MQATVIGTSSRGYEFEFVGRFLERVWHTVRGWSYNGGERDVRLDLIKGFAAFVMIADHISGNSFLKPLTGGDKFLVSAAEVFVFISGALMGIVYNRLIAKCGVVAAMRKALHRGAKLYLLTVVLTLAFAALGSARNLWWQ